MSAMPRMTISAPRELLREFVWLCHRRDKSASEVVREFIQEFVDSRFAEIDARDACGDLSVTRDRLEVVGDRSTEVVLVGFEAAACGPRGGDP